ncbi:angio-associated migratory cell protein-like [Pollicipes pollicipes]|uniref:angio-associated migratory cell protein-like n=1 Tax=Pollicipes pollicipes TaxID=41117 RepID=UPI001884E917|nr:angio-associated migratory cell protein-like [Pollicipes pollicipes]
MGGAGREHDTPPPSPFRGDDGERSPSPDELLVDDDGLVLEEVATLDDGSPPDDEDDEEDAAMAEELPEDVSRLTLAGHTGSAFCCALSPAGGALAASGGEDDCARVWRTDTGALQLTTDGHRDSVAHVAFSADGRLLATGDMAGLVQVYQLPAGPKVWDFDVGSDLTWLGWHSATAALLAGTQDGAGWMWRVPRGDTRTLAGHGSAWTAAALLPDGARLLAGYEDGSARLFQLRSGETLHQFGGALAHSAAVSCAAAQPAGVLVATASLDGWLRLYSAASGKLLGALDCAPDTPAAAAGDAEEDGAGPRSVEAAAFGVSDPGLLATATVGGVLTVWDVTTQRPRHRLTGLAGLSGLRWAPAAARLFAGCLDGAVLQLDARSSRLECRLTSAPCGVLQIDVSDDGRQLLAAMDDGKLRLFDVTEPEPT